MTIHQLSFGCMAMHRILDLHVGQHGARRSTAAASSVISRASFVAAADSEEFDVRPAELATV